MISAVAAAATPANGIPVVAADSAPAAPQPVVATTTGSAVLDLLTIFGAPTGSAQQPCGLPLGCDF